MKKVAEENLKKEANQNTMKDEEEASTQDDSTVSLFDVKFLRCQTLLKPKNKLDDIYKEAEVKDLFYRQLKSQYETNIAKKEAIQRNLQSIDTCLKQ